MLLSAGCLEPRRNVSPSINRPCSRTIVLKQFHSLGLLPRTLALSRGCGLRGHEPRRRPHEVRRCLAQDWHSCQKKHVGIPQTLKTSIAVTPEIAPSVSHPIDPEYPMSAAKIDP
jgi:hypothetical protein